MIQSGENQQACISLSHKEAEEEGSCKQNEDRAHL